MDKRGGVGGGHTRGAILLIEQIGQESMKYDITEGKGQKQPPGSDHGSPRARRGVEVIGGGGWEGHTGQMTDRGTLGKVTIFVDGKYFSSTVEVERALFQNTIDRQLW